MQTFFGLQNVTVLAPIFEPKVQKIANNIKKKNEENLFYYSFSEFFYHCILFGCHLDDK